MNHHKADSKPEPSQPNQDIRSPCLSSTHTCSIRDLSHSYQCHLRPPPKGVGCAVRDRGKVHMLPGARVLTYIFVAVSVLVVMLVAVPAREKVVRRGQSSRVEGEVIDSACGSSLTMAPQSGASSRGRVEGRLLGEPLPPLLPLLGLLSGSLGSAVVEEMGAGGTRDTYSSAIFVSFRMCT